jgi:hypothetical protein
MGSSLRKVSAVVFNLRFAHAKVEAIGLPFEHGGEVFAVHRPAYQEPVSARYVVSHVETGLGIPEASADTIDGAQAAAIAKLDQTGSSNLAQFLRAARRASALSAAA